MTIHSKLLRRIGPEGQIDIPPEILTALRLTVGDHLRAEQVGPLIVLTPVRTPPDGDKIIEA